LVFECDVKRVGMVANPPEVAEGPIEHCHLCGCVASDCGDDPLVVVPPDDIHRHLVAE
jgi:hypothetical protein